MIDALRKSLAVKVGIFIGLLVPQTTVASASERQHFTSLIQDARMDTSSRNVHYLIVDSFHSSGLYFISCILVGPLRFVAQFAFVPSPPGVNLALHTYCHAVGVFFATGTGDFHDVDILELFDQSWFLLILLAAVAQLEEPSITPRVGLPLGGDCQRMSETSSSSSHLLASQAQLLEAAEVLLRFVTMQVSMPARVKIIISCYQQGIAIPTGDCLGSELSLDIGIAIDVFK